jgi:hypothetical protein
MTFLTSQLSCFAQQSTGCRNVRPLLHFIAVLVAMVAARSVPSHVLMTESAPATAPLAQVVAASPQGASPIEPGNALLAGGVVFLVLNFRER